MSQYRRSNGQIALFLLSLMSLAIAIYLTIVHYNTQVSLVCSASGIVNCEHVLASAYAFLPGTTIPVSIAGILWSVGAAALSLGAWRFWPEKQSLRIAELVWAGLGMCSVFYLVYAELVFLHAICIWCTAVHIIVFLSLLIAAFLVYSARDEQEQSYAAISARPHSLRVE